MKIEIDVNADIITAIAEDLVHDERSELSLFTDETKMLLHNILKNTASISSTILSETEDITDAITHAASILNKQE